MIVLPGLSSGSAAWTVKNTPFTLTAKSSSKTASGAWPSGGRAPHASVDEQDVEAIDLTGDCGEQLVDLPGRFLRPPYGDGLRADTARSGVKRFAVALR